MKPIRRVSVTCALAALLGGGALPARGGEAAPTPTPTSTPTPTAPATATTTTTATPTATATATPTPTATATATAIPTTTATPTPTVVPASAISLTAPSIGGVKVPDDLTVEVHGRFYTGISADEREGWSRELGLREARIEVEARLGRALTVLEADLSAREPIKDAFLRLDGPFATRLTAGRFKAPFSQRRLTSSWKLPLVGRGLVDDYVVERNALGGRRLGLTGALRPWEGKLEVAVGVFGSDATDRNDGTAEDYAARVAARPWKALEVGASAYRAARTPVGARHEAGAAHLRLDAWGLEAVVEGMVGTIAPGRFVSGTAVATFTLRFLSGRLGVAPLAGVEWLELRTAEGGRAEAAIGGAVFSWQDGLKLKVQAERARRPGETAPSGALALELGTRF